MAILDGAALKMARERSKDYSHFYFFSALAALPANFLPTLVIGDGEDSEEGTILQLTFTAS